MFLWQVRVAQTLTELLQQHKRELSRAPGAGGEGQQGVGEGGRQEGEGEGPCALVLPWRPLMELLLNTCSSPPPRLEGGAAAASFVYCLWNCLLLVLWGKGCAAGVVLS